MAQKNSGILWDDLLPNRKNIHTLSMERGRRGLFSVASQEIKIFPSWEITHEKFPKLSVMVSTWEHHQ